MTRKCAGSHLLNQRSKGLISELLVVGYIQTPKLGVALLIYAQIHSNTPLNSKWHMLSATHL